MKRGRIRNRRAKGRSAVQRALLLAFAVAVLIGCSGSSEEDGGTTARNDSEERGSHEGEHTGVVRLTAEAVETIDLRTAAVERRRLDTEIRATAAVEPNEYALAHIGPRIPGRAIGVHVELGDEVEEGDVLAELDSIELGEKKAAFVEATARLEIARRNHDREKRLFEKEISSEKEFLDAKGELERARVARHAAREALRLVGLPDERIEDLRWGGREDPLSSFVLIAPFGGTVIERDLTLGEPITPQDRPFTIADLSTVWILIDVHEKDVARVEVGQEVRIRVDAFPEKAFQGSVAYFSSVLEPATRTAKARVEVPNPDRRLRPGMFARATITVPDPGRREVLVVPREAIQRTEHGEVAFVVEGDGAYEARRVRTGRRTDRAVEIVSGLDEGELVVTRGGFSLKSELEKEAMAGHAH